MKNFKKVLFGVLAMLVMVTGVSAERLKEDHEIETNAAFDNCITSTADVVKCTVTKDLTLGSTSRSVTGKNVTLNIANGVTVNLGSDLDVATNANITINGGKIVLASGKSIKVAAKGILKINGVEIENSGSSELINVVGGVSTSLRPSDADYTYVTVDSASKLTSTANGIVIASGIAKVSLNGDWATTGNIVENTAGDSEITFVGGKYVSSAKVLEVTTGNVNVVVNGGTYTAGDDAFNLTDGTLTVNNAIVTVDVTSKSAVKVSGAGALVVENGTLTVKDSFVVDFTSTGKLVISNGTFTTKGDATAIHRTSSDPAESAITGGTFIGNGNTNGYTITNVLPEGYSIVMVEPRTYVVGKTHQLDITVDNTNGETIELHTPQTLLGGYTYTFAYLADQKYLSVKAAEGYVVKYVLVVDGKETVIEGTEFTMPDADATLKVSFVAASEKNPENQGGTVDPGTTTDPKDETTDKNPGTFDGIASFVTLAVSSLGAAGYSIKKVIKR